MATIPLPERPDVTQLRNLARELQRKVRAGDPTALTLVREHFPKVAALQQFPLSAAQLVLARRYGFPSWARLQRHVKTLNERSWTPGDAPEHETSADRFLRLACLTYSDDDAPARRAEAAALLAHDPALPTTHLGVAAACADIDAIRRLLAADPTAATRGTGPYDWSPLLYQAYARHDDDLPADRTVAAARLLLDAGADPNDGRFWNGLPTPFTVLTGVFGSADEQRPAHPNAVPFARALLAAGADPNDGQALYNRMFSDDDDFLPPLFDYGLGHDTGGPWHALLGDSLDPPAVMVRSLLTWAVDHDQRARVELLAERGVDVTSPLPVRLMGAAAGRTPLARALLSGHLQLADQLRTGGAHEPDLDAVDQVVAALMSGSALPTSTRALAAAQKRRPGLAVWAAGLGNSEAVLRIVRAGWDVDALGRADVPVEQEWETSLHVAAGDGDVELVQALLRLGADATVPDRRFTATARGWAEHFGHADVAALLPSR